MRTRMFFLRTDTLTTTSFAKRIKIGLLKGVTSVFSLYYNEPLSNYIFPDLRYVWLVVNWIKQGYDPVLVVLETPLNTPRV